MDTSSSSKVTVEYHDPSGVFPLISKDLTNRLPLRNLNWQSHARPLRQIKHLHVEFVPSPETQAALRPRQNGHKPADSIDILKSGFEPAKAAVKQPRHQVPGLRTTPYLKLYILRCDDKDWYKQEERNKLKAWVRDVKNEDGREHHDAAEWLIVHVVIPDTVAASEPRWRESSRDPDELKERSKGKKTVLDRLRADFNGDKSYDHIAQLRLLKSQIAVDLLPVPALAKTVEETADEREKSWADLLTKIRMTILTSFDARVRQYEEDIAEQESRRSLPGWNFCTFFINKEGLARALESVGLVEDALAIYDELLLDLETVLTDLASGQASQTATTFSTTGPDVLARVSEDDADPSRLYNKGYRQEIVRSAISVFDFFCYLFTRQMSLILRLAGRTNVAASGIKEGGDDLVMLAEVCWRGLTFLHNAARSLKQDLTATLPHEVQTIVHAWTYYAADSILAVTQSSYLSLTDDGIKFGGKIGPASAPAFRKEFGFSMGADAYPQRKSSLPSGKPPVAAKSTTTTSSVGKISEDGFFSPPSSSGGDGLKTSEVPGVAELAAYRAELIMLKRKNLDALAAMRNWRAGWSSLTEAALVNGKSNVSALGTDLTIAVENEAAYQVAFEGLTDSAMRHYLLATHQKTAESLMGDLAVLKHSQGDHVAAATYFEHVLPAFEVDGWDILEMKALALQVASLTALERQRDGLQVALQLFALHVRRIRPPNDALILKTIDTGHLTALAGHLSEPYVANLNEYITDIKLPHWIRHREDQDGFTYVLRFHNLMPDLVAECVEVLLQHVDNPSHTIILRTSHAPKLPNGDVEVNLVSNVTTTGIYKIKQIDVKLRKLVFRHCVHPEQPSNSLLSDKETNHTEVPEEKQTYLLLYPAEQAIDVKLNLSSTISIGKARYLNLEIDSGWNDIQSMDVRLKPTSAGLRLHLDDVRTSSIELSKKSDDTNALCLGILDARSSAQLVFAYSLEHVLPSVGVHAEINFMTAKGHYVYSQDMRVQTALPLDVEVKDVFHLDSLFSTFTVRSTDRRPVIVDSISLHDSQAYHVHAPPIESCPTIILAHQPFECAYKITTKRARAGMKKQDTSLELSIRCVAIGELVQTAIKQAFRKEIAKSEFAGIQRLLLHLIVPRCLNHYTDADMELAVLLRETNVPSFADLDWFEVIDTLPEDIQRPLSDWLMKWHIENQKISLDVASETITESITIALDVPTPDYTFLSCLNNDDRSDGVLVLGQITTLHLQIRYTRRWSSGQGQDLTKSSERSGFAYEIQADQSIWMLSGCKKMQFNALELDGTLEAQVDVVPLKPGKWVLPAVVIRPALDQNGSSVASYEASCPTADQIKYVISSESTSRIVMIDDSIETRQMPILDYAA